MHSRQNILFRERVRTENRISQQFNENWGWLVKEYEREHKEVQTEVNAKPPETLHLKGDLKPMPKTSAGVIGWLSARPEFRLEVFGPDVPQAPELPGIYWISKTGDPLSDGLDMCAKDPKICE